MKTITQDLVEVSRHILSLENYGPITLAKLKINSISNTIDIKPNDDLVSPYSFSINGQIKELDESIFCVGTQKMEKRFQKRKLRPIAFKQYALKEALSLVKEDYMNAYLQGKGYTIDFKYRRENDLNEIRNALLKEKYNLFVRDNSSIDGLFYDYNAKPILRSYYVDYARGHITEGNYNNIQLIKNLLGLKPNVPNIQYITVPYYNESIEGEQALEFTYTPTYEQFCDLLKSDEDSIHKIVRKFLDLKRFQRND